MPKNPKPRRNRKISDDQVIRLNNLGMSMTTIADILGCHATAVTARLRQLEIPPMDTRRSFLESIYNDLTEAQQAWVAEKIGLNGNIRSFLIDLIIKGYEEDNA